MDGSDFRIRFVSKLFKSNPENPSYKNIMEDLVKHWSKRLSKTHVDEEKVWLVSSINTKVKTKTHYKNLLRSQPNVAA
jgi:hypothetical protein